MSRNTSDQNAAIICVTHDEMILDRFDHIFRLRDGRLEIETPIDPRLSVAKRDIEPLPVDSTS
jgi:ABC-type lipoprotein export system ATPase subunit